MSTRLDAKWRFVQAACTDAKLSPGAVRMAIAVCRYDGSDGHCWASYETLAEAAGVKRRAAINLVQELETAGWVRLERTRGRTSNRIFPAYERASTVHGDAPLTVHGDAPLNGSNGARNSIQRCTSVHPNALSSRESERGHALTRAHPPGARPSGRRRQDPAAAMLAAAARWGGGE